MNEQQTNQTNPQNDESMFSEWVNNNSVKPLTKKPHETND